MGYNRPSKNNYQQRISTYQKRKAELLEKYGKGAEYRKRVVTINKSICNWQASLRRYNKRNDLLATLDEHLHEYFNVYAKGNIGTQKTSNKCRLHIAVKVFCKYAIEAKIKPTYVSEYIGWQQAVKSGRYRLQFTRSFKTHPENRILWHKFKQFVKEHT